MTTNTPPASNTDGLDGALRNAFHDRDVAARSRAPSVIDEIERLTGAAPHVLLRDDPAEAAGTPLIDPRSPESRGLPRGHQSFELMGEVARGGMGVILKGHDRDLGRDVAVKVLRTDRAGNAALVQRFVEEAQIGGQLQHPGIVPVYELGLMEDDRPYFTMKLIKGRTLAEILSDRKSANDERRRMLGIFEQMCQTVAYAHARGVIHRDLKPSNVMVGAFGEVLVMDWGLAKVLRRGGTADEKRAKVTHASVIETVRSAPGSDGSHSLVGSVMGTPAYMSPEQARGDVERVDERTDVFSLGAILCEILTGKPPYTGDGDETLVEAANAKLEPALERLAQCEAEPELVALAQRCLIAAAPARLRNAGAIAQELAAFFAATEERSRLAQLAAEKSRVQAAEERKRRKLVGALLGSLLLLVVVGGGAWLMSSQAHHARIARGDREIGKVIEHAALLRGEQRYDDALASVEQAQAMIASGQASGETLDRVAALKLETEALARDARAERERAERKHRLLARLDAAYARSLDVMVIGSAESMYTEVAGAFSDFGIDITHLEPKNAADVLLAGGVAAEAAPALDLLGLNFFGDVGDPESSRRALEIARLLDPDPFHSSVRDALVARDARALRTLHHDPRVASLSAGMVVAFGLALGEGGYMGEAIEFLRHAAVAHPADVFLLSVVGICLCTDSATIEAKREGAGWFRAAQALQPDSPFAVRMLAHALRVSGEVEQGLAVSRSAVQRNPESADAHATLAQELNESGDHDAAIVELKRAAALGPKQARVFSELGELSMEEDPEGALEAFRRGLVVAIDPMLTMRLHVNAGEALLRLGRDAEGEAEFRAAIAMAPENEGTHAMIGIAATKLGRRDRAIESFRESLRLDPKNVYTRYQLAKLVGDRDGAPATVALLEEGLALMPDATRFMNGLAWVLATSRDSSVRDPVRALELATRALALEPNNINFVNTLGVAQYAGGKLDESLATLRRSVQLSGDENFSDWVFLAMALERTGQHEEALTWLDKSAAWLAEHAGASAEYARFQQEAEAMIRR